MLWSFALAAIPFERRKVNRQSLDTLSELLEDGWNLVIFPEGGRSPDGWTQPFSGASPPTWPGAPAVPSCRSISTAPATCSPRSPMSARRHPAVRAPKGVGGGQLRRSPISVLFGAPLTPDEGENAHRFSDRIEAAVANLSREVHADWWQARRAVSTVDPDRRCGARTPGAGRTRLAPGLGPRYAAVQRARPLARISP